MEIKLNRTYRCVYSRYIVYTHVIQVKMQTNTFMKAYQLEMYLYLNFEI